MQMPSFPDPEFNRSDKIDYSLLAASVVNPNLAPRRAKPPAPGKSRQTPPHP